MDGSATPGPGQAHLKSNSMIYICGGIFVIYIKSKTEKKMKNCVN